MTGKTLYISKHIQSLRRTKPMNTEEKYKIGGIYWAKNPKAGRNRMSQGVLLGWTPSGMAVLENKRWGIFYATTENMDKHN